MNEHEETLQIFFAETEDLLRRSEESLLRLEEAPVLGHDLEELFRAIHTLKSGSAMVGFNTLSKYVHLIENLLDRIRDNQLSVTRPLISVLLEDVDFIRAMVDSSAAGEGVDSDVLNTRKARLNRFLGIKGASGEEEATTETPARSSKPEDWRYYYIDLKFREDLFGSGHNPLLLLLNLTELGECVEVTADISELPGYKEMDFYKLYISWRVILKTTASIQEVEDVFMFVKDENKIVIEEITDRYREGVDLQLGEMPLGEVLVERGGITREDLKGALDKQKKLGEILVDEGKIDKEALQKVVSLQQESRSTYRKTSLRVDVKKIDCLVNLAEEIGINLFRVQSLLDSEGSRDEIEQEMENLVKVNREFQERIVSVRMFSLKGTFQRFQRVVRDTACAQKKRIKVILSGVDTELDKEVIEYIADPLKHLIRNCVDHGIEPPEERVAAGKPAEGIIEFKAYQRGGKIVIQISDDGRGLDLKKIRSRALEMGIDEAGEKLDNNSLVEIICHPGFSTASSVTELSGRGVGMDVVKTQVERIGGLIQIETKKGKGTVFTLILPLTFTLIEALHVRDQDRSYLVPLWGIMGVQKFEAGRMRTFGADEKVYRFREDYLPLMNLFRGWTIAPERYHKGMVAVFLDTGRQRFGILVDEVLNSYPVVIKTIESNYQSVKGVMGATIMGDGSAAIVVDLLGLEEIFFKHSLLGGEV
ncbi:MAG: chemotaxis protein CheA [Deltaproteobacteria bacterium]|nr:chemotaxis protein CheA [Deltaproteobacteria bacterium]